MQQNIQNKSCDIIYNGLSLEIWNAWHGHIDLYGSKGQKSNYLKYPIEKYWKARISKYNSGISTTKKSKIFTKKVHNLHHIRSLFMELFVMPYSEAFVTSTTVKI